MALALATKYTHLDGSLCQYHDGKYIWSISPYLNGDVVVVQIEFPMDSGYDFLNEAIAEIYAISSDVYAEVVMEGAGLYVYRLIVATTRQTAFYQYLVDLGVFDIE